MSLEPLFQIVADAIDPEAFRPDSGAAEWEMRRRTALARAKAGIRIAQALGWRFYPPGDFEQLGADQLDAHCERAISNMRDASEILEGGKHGG